MLITGESAVYELSVYPADAILDSTRNHAEWSSSDTSVVTVDRNGIVTAVGAGSATVTATLTADGTAFTDSVTVTVTAGAFKTACYYTSSTVVAVSAFANVTDLSVSSGGALADGNLTLTADEAVITSGDQSVTVKRVTADAIGFVNYSLLNGSTIRMDNLPTYLKVVRLTTGEAVNAVFTSSDEAVATVENGAVKGLARGEVTITAEAGGQTAAVTFKVFKPISYFKLTDNELLDKRGIAAETVYANATFTGAHTGELIYTRAFGITMPTEVVASDFIWTTSNPDIAWFDADVAGLLYYAEDFEGVQNLTITATAKLSVYSNRPVSVSYTFKLVDGINVSDAWEFNEATEVKSQVSCFTKSIDTAWDGGRVDDFYCNNDVYGNGYAISNVNPERVWEGWSLLILSDNLKVSNLAIRNAPEPKAGQTIDKTAHKQAGIMIDDYEVDGKMVRKENVTLEYLIIEYCKFGIKSYGSDFTLTGCIIRNTSSYGIYMSANAEREGYNNYSSAVVTNCIFSNSVATAIGMPNFDYECNGKINYEEDGVTPMRCYSKLTIEGFCDIYNWATIENLDMFTDLTGDETADSIIKNIAQDLIKTKQYDQFRVPYKGEDYFHLGIMCSGALHKSSAQVVDGNGVKVGTEGCNLRNFTNTEADLYGLVEPIQFFIYDKNSSITPESTYSDTAETYARLRGETL